MKQSRVFATTLVIAVATSFSNIGSAQEGLSDTEILFQRVAVESLERAERRIEGVDFLVKRMESTLLPGPAPPGAGPCAMGGCVALKNENGAMRLLTPTEVQVLAGLTADAAQMTLFGAGLIAGQEMFNDGITAEMQAVSPELGLLARGLAGDFGAGESIDPWANPFQMMGFGGVFVTAGARALDEAADSIASGPEVARAQAEARRELMESGRHAGVVVLNDQQAHEFVVENINQVVEVDGGDTFTMVDARMWFDTDELVMLKHRVDGIARQGGRDVPFYIETESKDFRHLPGSSLYEPFETVSRMGGMLDDEQMAQMEEAQVQLEEFDRQMASMPPEQRAMAERMMGGQMDMMRNLVNTGAFETSQKFVEMYVNPDLAELYRANAAATAASSPQQSTGGNLVARIQADLQALGYDPGAVNGELTTPTVVAISQFQAEKGLEVTGEATQELAEALTAELSQ